MVVFVERANEPVVDMASWTLPEIICIILSFSTVVLSQTGTDCRADHDCFPDQICNFGYCQCQLGFIKYIYHCFPNVGYGQECAFPEQCGDFRMLCERDPNDSKNVKRCLCDRYHEWNSEITECVQIRNLTDEVSTLEEKNKWAEEIEHRGKRVFVGLVIAGLTAISIGLILAMLCTIYGCCFREKLPREKPNETEKPKGQEVASMGSTQGTYVAIPTDLTTQSVIQTC